MCSAPTPNVSLPVRVRYTGGSTTTVLWVSLQDAMNSNGVSAYTGKLDIHMHLLGQGRLTPQGIRRGLGVI